MYWEAAGVLPLDSQKRAGDYALVVVVVTVPWVVKGQGECSAGAVHVQGAYGPDAQVRGCEDRARGEPLFESIASWRPPLFGGRGLRRRVVCRPWWIDRARP